MARKRSKANYFTSETEEYIKKYNTSTDQEYRNQIFTDHIYIPFYKLAENIIHTFKFYYTDVDQIEDLKHEIVSVLLEEKIMKFDPTNGAKAYSYFGTIVKRWLINYNNKNYKRLKQIGSFSDIEDSFEEDLDLDSPSGKTLAKFLDEWVEEMYEELDEHFIKDSDKQIADAVLTIFRTRHDLDLFKKKALYIYIREMTDCETPHLTRVISILKEQWIRRYQYYYDQGLLSNNPL
jgi:DNA-directed RNA polymerase specialized sigma subunit